MKLLTGFGNGVINVLPSGSFIKFCRDNVTNAYTGYTTLVSNLGKSNTLVLTNYAKLLHGFGEASFNCFYSVTDPTNASENPSGIKYIGWNILYNLGYMYTDAKKSVDIFKSSTSQYQTLGQYIGDFTIRFLYSRYSDVLAAKAKAAKS